jgi:hypothetical protein
MKNTPRTLGVNTIRKINTNSIASNVNQKIQMQHISAVNTKHEHPQILLQTTNVTKALALKAQTTR